MTNPQSGPVNADRRKAKAGGIAAERLKNFIERIEKLREEKKAIGGDERDVFSEAKGVGFDAKAMREVLRLRAMDAADRDEWQTLVDTYQHALGVRGEAAAMVASGATYEEAAEKTGVSRATVARTVASIKNVENETVAEITPPQPEDHSTDSVPEAAGGMAVQEDASASSAAPVPNAGAAGGADAPAPNRRIEAPMQPTVGAIAASSPRVAAPIDDDLEIPPFLKRHRETVTA